MNSVYNVIIRPIVTERSFDLMSNNKYTFEVAANAPKEEIADAIEKIFDVKVVKVNTMWVKPKTKRVRYVAGQTRRWKKAIVTLAEGDTIEVFGQQAAQE
ncbi:50S ribosomal protein L23 [Olsenella uli]|uniref:50S ribosomal protein L23 n=1 Tax=Olsenella uli TaxID=133926 RepID=UPI0012ABF9C3|nr:50S ribosomal protein L23 [Olsenella uli]